MRFVVLLALAATLGGCVGGGEPVLPAAPPGGLPPAADWSAVEAISHLSATFRVLTSSGGPIDVAGYVWFPEEPAETIVLATHGSGGGAEVLWGPCAVPGYSFGHRVAESGRAFVAIDRPGFGGSATVEETQTLEEHAVIMAQVAAQLREGSYSLAGAEARPFSRVVGLGHSVGAFLTVMSQGLHAPFDAIVPMGWTSAGFRQEFRDCINRAGPCAQPWREDVFFLDNMDSRVIAWFENLTVFEPGEPGLLMDPEFAVQTGCFDCLHPGLRALETVPDVNDAIASRIAVPVLLVVAVEDGIVEPTSQQEEQAVFSSTDDLTVMLLDRTSHLLWHHLNHEEVVTGVLAWLGEKQL